MSESGSSTIRLAGGRDLDIYTSGPENGPVLLFHHGTPGSRVPFRAIERAAHERGLRFLTFSRAGYGGSTRLPGRRVVDVVGDVAALLDAVDIERALVAGWSGGGPHALACGALLADRTPSVIVMAGVAPYGQEGFDWLAGMGQGNIDEFGAAFRGEEALRTFIERARVHMLEASPRELAEVMNSLLPEVDRRFITGEVAEDLAGNMHEALRDGVDGWLDDDIAFIEPWGFDLSEVSAPTCLWQGSEDPMVPFSHGEWQAERIPGVAPHLEGGEGHFSISIGAVGRMLDEAMGRL
jgi:pimeloyl-ACP methyl ester carboxylesterase